MLGGTLVPGSNNREEMNTSKHSYSRLVTKINVRPGFKLMLSSYACEWIRCLMLYDGKDVANTKHGKCYNIDQLYIIMLVNIN